MRVIEGLGTVDEVADTFELGIYQIVLQFWGAAGVENRVVQVADPGAATAPPQRLGLGLNPLHRLGSFRLSSRVVDGRGGSGHHRQRRTGRVRGATGPGPHVRAGDRRQATTPPVGSGADIMGRLLLAHFDGSQVRFPGSPAETPLPWDASLCS